MELADLGHGFTSFALWSVFSVLLMTTLTMTTRCTFAVT
jgi:hypothetical protein